MRYNLNSNGFALPASILVIALLTIGVTTAFVIVSSESQTIDNARDQLDALGIAQSGLELFLVARDSLGFTAVPPAVYESTTVNFGNGSADVVLELIRPSVDGSLAMYLIRSRGIRSDPELPGIPAAEHTVAQYAQFSTGTLTVGAAFTALTGLLKNGAFGTIAGADQCGAADDLAGVDVPTPPGYTQTGGSPVPTGSPPINDMGTYQEAADSTQIDWAGIVDGSSITPDIVLPGGTWPSGGAFSDPSYWPVILVNGDFSLPTSGKGTLIVTDNLTIDGNLSWRGVIFAGGGITGNGDNTVSGAMVSGLNIKLGPADSIAAVIGQNSTGRGTKTIVYNSCNVTSAMAGFEGLSPIPNAWANNWAIY